MKRAAPSRPRLRRRASVTLVSLCLTAVLGISVGSYLTLCSRSSQLSARTASQDLAQELAQIGLEEALWALNQNRWTSSGPESNASWSTSGTTRSISLTYTLATQNASGQVALTIANSTSTGPTWPSITSVATVTLAGGPAFTKTLQATTQPAPLFGNAVASSDSYVSFVAGGTVDSWNSDPDNNPATTAVGYSFTAGNAGNYNAVVAARGNGTYGVVLTQATVRGYVATFGLPISHSTSGSPMGRVLGPATASSMNVDPTRLGKSAFVPTAAFDVTLPATNGPNFGGLINNTLGLVSALLLGSPSTNVYKTSGDLLVLGLPLLAPSITVDRPLKIIIDGDLSITGAGRITVTATGSLELFVTGDVNIAGNGMRNLTGDPRKMAVYCTSGATSDALEFNTDEDFCGVIFCENKPIDIRRNATFYGALLSRQYVRFSAGATAPILHYDTALRQTRFSGVSTPYVIKKLTEP